MGKGNFISNLGIAKAYANNICETEQDFDPSYNKKNFLFHHHIWASTWVQLRKRETTIHTYIIFGHIHVILTDVSLLNTDNKRSSSQGDIEWYKTNMRQRLWASRLDGSALLDIASLRNYNWLILADAALLSQRSQPVGRYVLIYHVF